MERALEMFFYNFRAWNTLWRYCYIFFFEWNALWRYYVIFSVRGTRSVFFFFHVVIYLPCDFPMFITKIVLV